MNPPRMLALGFAVTIALGTLLLTLPIATETGEILPFTQALFTATSATAVTGLTVSNTADTFSTFGEIVILIMIQIGGIGLMVFSTFIAILLGKKITLTERLLIRESFNKEGIGGVVRLVISILKFTFVAESVGGIILGLYWLPRYGYPKAFYYGFFHSISAFCNAGFDLFDNSMTDFTGDVVVNFVIIGLFVIGGLGFSVNLELFKKHSWYKLTLHSKIVIATTIILNILGAAAILALESTNPRTLALLPVGGKILGAFFQAMTPRTAGFFTVPLENFRDATLLLIMFLMFVGASPGSTGGGIKTTTLATLTATIYSTVKGRKHAEIFNRSIAYETVLKALAVTTVSLFLILGIVFILLITESISFTSLLFEVVSAFGTVGLSVGATPKLSEIGRVVISLLMFTGRIGPLTLAFAIAQRQRVMPGLKRPEEKIIIG